MSLINKAVSFINNSVVSNLVVPAKIEPKTEFSLKEKCTKYYYLMLKDNEKTYAKVAKVIREEAVRSKGHIRYNLRHIKKQQGNKARMFHLALGFIKGKKYSEMEPNVRPENKVRAKDLEDTLYIYLEYKYRKHVVDNKEIQKFLES